MGSGERVATEPGHEGKIEVENILQPLDGGSRLICEDLDQVWSRLVTGGLEGIFVELLDAVADLVVDLSASKRTIDSGGGLCRVATEEV